MRQIKFRGWHPDAKDMVFFGLGEDHINCMGLHDGENYTFRLEVEYPVMQFTGLHDKNGVEVFEGDVVIIKDTSGSGRERRFGPKAVRWDGQQCGFNVSSYSSGTTVEVIGNIHQNPELLECK